MTTIERKFFLFLVVCIGSRLLLAYIAKNISNELLKYMGYLILLPAIGFIYIYLSGIRNTGTGAFGQKIWWNNLRPIHGLLYLLFSYNAINGKKIAWIYLFIDVLVGLISFLFYNFNSDVDKVNI
jgi:hypothetical protein